MKLTKEQLILLYTSLVRSRKLDELCVKGLSEGKLLGFFHSGQGQEAVGVGGCTLLKPDDYIYPHHRGHGLSYLIAKGGSLRAFLAEHHGKATGACGGISGFHNVAPDIGIFGGSGTIGSAFPVSLGWGLAAKKNARGQVTVCFFGDGSSNRGTLHEAFNMSALWKLPIVWVCDNNGVAQYMPIKDAYPRDDIADLAAGYDMPGVVVDGQDVLAVCEAVTAAVERARAGEGPSVVECKTHRFRSHAEGVPDVYHVDPRPAGELESGRKRDPVALFREKLLAQGVLTEADVERIDREADEEMKELEKFAMESPVPERSVLERALYAD